MAFWSGEKLLANVKRLKIVEPYSATKIDCSAYTLTLGPEFFVSPDYSVAGRDNVKQYLATPAEIQVAGGQWKLAGGELIVPPGQFALLLTEEFVKIPPNAMGFISLKFGVKGPGLINVSGFHVDPGFEGRLIFSVYNAGPSPAHLNRGQDVFLLWLADLDQVSKKVKPKPKPGHRQAEIPLDMIAKADRPMHSLQSLSDRIEGLNTQLTIFKTVVLIVVGIATLIFAGLKAIAPSEPVQNSMAPASASPAPPLSAHAHSPSPPQPVGNAT